MILRSAGLTARSDRKEALDLAGKLADYLEENGLAVVPDPEIAEHINRAKQAVPLHAWKTDFIVIIGGDGTILRTCIHLPKPEPPVLAINMGERGFLAEVSPEGAVSTLGKILEGEFKLERCRKLAITVEGETLPDGLNEVYISPDTPVKLLYAEVWKDGTCILDCRADGILIASQTGSTGYSMAAGGPVLDPETQVVVATPVCPLTPFPPIVFSQNSNLTVEVEKPRTVLVTIDGYYRRLVEGNGPRITVSRSDNVTSFMRFGESFYQRLQGRMLYPKR